MQSVSTEATHKIDKRLCGGSFDKELSAQFEAIGIPDNVLGDECDEFGEYPFSGIQLVTGLIEEPSKEAFELFSDSLENDYKIYIKWS